MGNAVWIREALIGREIIAVNGEKAAITDLGATGAILESQDTEQTYVIAMQEITAAIHLWGRLKRAPNPEEVSSLGLHEAEASFLVPLIVAIRNAPQVQDWLDDRGQEMTGMHQSHGG